jgi:plastocyanin
VLFAACSGGDSSTDAAAAADTDLGVTDGTVYTGENAAMDIPAAAFRAIVPCTNETDFVFAQNIHVITSPTPAYSPRCVKVPPTTVIYIDASNDYPFEWTESEPNGAPVHDAGAVTFTTRPVFGLPGFYPFDCIRYGAMGMKGVVWVTP